LASTMAKVSSVDTHENSEGVSQVLILCWTGARRDSSMEEERSRRFRLLHILHGGVNQHL